MKAKKLLLLTSFLVAGLLSVSAQGSFEDDIYYNPSKDKKAKQEKVKKSSNSKGSVYNPSLGGHDYSGSDEYIVNTANNRDVDEYNRRSGHSSTRTANGGNMNQDDFTYTRRIEKYHNGDVISAQNDPELVEYYYSEAQPNVNVYINYPGSAWYSPWAYDYGWYSPWYWNSWYGPSWAWGPSWSWSWGWGPSWAWGPSWSWGWGPSWAWGPSWSWGWGGPGWGAPGWAWTRPGNYTPNGRRPVGVRNGYTGLGSNRVNGINHGNSGNRGFGNGATGNFRPGNGNNVSRPAYRPANTNQNNNGNSYNRTTGNRTNRNSYINNTNPNRNNNNSYSTPSRSNNSGMGGFGGGSRGGGMSGGGSHRGGRR